jgi:hypothetical protein
LAIDFRTKTIINYQSMKYALVATSRGGITPAQSSPRSSHNNKSIVRDIEGRPMRLVVISDTHGLHNRIEDLSDGDVLVHAGDFMNSGYDPEDIRSFNRWLGAHSFKRLTFSNASGFDIVPPV